MIALTPMTDKDYSAYLDRAVQGYADEHVKAGNWSQDEALERSRKEFEGLLPKGVQTPSNYIFTLLNEASEKVGFIWYAIQPERPQRAFIYDFEVYETFRRRGYANQSLAAMEQDAKPRGVRQVELHVFGHNTAARALYRKAGFEETNVIMTKTI